MNLILEPYLAQLERWPKTGRHILAQYTDETIVVYQAYKPSIGHFAAGHGYFGGEFRLDRMSWIKTNFLWMMYRSGWSTKTDQEMTLAVHLKRAAFDMILNLAVHSTFLPAVYSTESEWKAALSNSPVRLQWDPDHRPTGERVERRAIQLGLRGEVLTKYAREWVICIEDISSFVAEEHHHVWNKRYTDLLTPRETVYPVSDETVRRRIGLSND